MAALRLCRRCKTEKAPEAFYAGANSWCKECNRAYYKARYAHAKAYGKAAIPRVFTEKIYVRVPIRDNFTVPCTKHELAMLQLGEQIVRQALWPWFALQIITDIWAATKKGNA